MSGENSPVRALIVEDEILAREELTELALTRNDIRIAGMAKNGEEALEKLNAEEYDLVFLDVNLPVLNGIEVLERLEKRPYVIFTTVSRDHAADAFELGAVDYLHKPFTAERFHQALDRALRFLQGDRLRQEPPRKTDRSRIQGLLVTEGEDHHLVAFRDIIYVSSHDRRSVIHTEKKDYETSRLLKEIEEKLPASVFHRIHRRYILNLNYISRIQNDIGGRFQVFLRDSDETSLPVGRTYAQGFRAVFKM